MRDAAAGALFRGLSLAFALLPRRAVLRAGEALGGAAFALDRRRREIALGNLRTAFGDSLDAAARREIARQSFRSFGRLTADIVKLSTASDRRLDRLVDVEGAEHIVAALRGGRGAIVVTGHIGNWEVAARPISRLGTLNVVARRLDSAALEKPLLRLRNRLGGRVIDKTHAARTILAALRRNEIVAVLIDQNVLRREGVFVDFFGRPASTTPSAALFHLRTGAPLVPIVCVPAAGGRYRLEIRPPVEVAGSGGGADDVLKTTALLTKMLEAEIRRRPGTWLWFHDRWRSRPSGES